MSSDAGLKEEGGLEQWRDGTHNGVDFRVPSKFGWWRPRQIEGEDYVFRHLWPFDFSLERPANPKYPALNILLTVNFDCHVVSGDFDPSVHGAAQSDDSRIWIDTGGAMRCFDKDRYDRSSLLPDMIRGLGSSRTACYRARKDNYMIWRPEGAGKEGPCYQAFFKLTRPTKTPDKLLLYVQSAYLKELPHNAQWESRLNFVGQCAKLMGA